MKKILMLLFVLLAGVLSAVDPHTGPPGILYPTYYSQYENSMLGEAVWGISSLICFPLTFVVAPVTGQFDPPKSHSSYYGPTPFFAKVYSGATRYVSEKYFVFPVYHVLSFPVLTVKHVCYDLFFTSDDYSAVGGYKGYILKQQRAKENK